MNVIDSRFLHWTDSFNIVALILGQHKYMCLVKFQWYEALEQLWWK